MRRLPVPLEALFLAACFAALFAAAALRAAQVPPVPLEVDFAPYSCPAPPAGAVPPGFTVVSESCGITR